jgi:hypothetical protein
MALIVPTPAHPLTNPPPTGRVDLVWFKFFQQLAAAVNSDGGGVAPGDGVYVVGAPDASLPNARVATDSPTVDVDLTVPGIIKWHATGAGGWVPLSLGVEPLTFVSDGAGSPILVGYTP